MALIYKVWLTYLLILLAGAFYSNEAKPSNCLLFWDAVTTYVDGSPLDKPVKEYRLYQGDTNGSFDYKDPYLIIPGDQLKAEVLCRGNKTWEITAVVGGVESEVSNRLSTKEPAKTTLKITVILSIE